MQVFLHPLPLLGLVLGIGLVIAATQLVQKMHLREDPPFGFSALLFVAYLSAISFLTGFSIGCALSIINTCISLLFIIVAKYYRLQIFVCSVISALLVLFMRGYFVPARYILQGLMIVLVLISAYRIVSALIFSDRRALGSAILAIVASLSGLAMIIPLTITVWIISLAIGICITVVIFTRYYRLQLIIIMASDLLWLMNVIIQN